MTPVFSMPRGETNSDHTILNALFQEGCPVLFWLENRRFYLSILHTLPNILPLSWH